MYTKTVYKLHKESQYLKRQDATPGSSTSSVNAMRKTRLLNEKRFLYTVILVCFITAATQIPINITQSVTSVTSLDSILPRKNYTILHHTVRFLYLLFISNFCFNPFIYCWRLTNYRNTFSRLFCSTGLCWKCRTISPSNS